MTRESVPFDSAAFLKTLPNRPGVYRMLGDKSDVLYVGKAKNLKRRVSSYFNKAQNLRVQKLISRVHGIELTVTHTEAEALLLENNLIKTLQPRYNVLLKDDKSYPYIFLSAGPFPRLSFHRGARKEKGRYFGPYPSAGAVRETLQLLQRVFPVRQCEDSYYRNRTRPCLQYQIQRCTAPCVDFVSEEEYGQDVEDTVSFLKGRANQIIDNLVSRMERASDSQEYEKAALLRDRIATLRRIQERQYVSGEGGDLDVIACAIREKTACVQLFFVRGGWNLGNKAFFLRAAGGATPKDIISAFVAQHYLEQPVPSEILVSHEPNDRELLQEVFSVQAGKRVSIKCRFRMARRNWMSIALQNAEAALAARLDTQASMESRFDDLQHVLGLDQPIQRAECFDISHTQGEKAVGSCVVFDRGGPAKQAYRRFNIRGVEPGDDYAAMAQTLRRRLSRIGAGEEVLPDLLIIDGGAGQLGAAREAVDDIGIPDVVLLGIAKGPDRKPGFERIFLSGQLSPLILEPDSPALLLLQQIRDEAHRFAISGHRKSRSKSRRKSILEEVPGIGPKRRAQLLRQFGGLQELERAGVEDIARVTGISRDLAERIYSAFHGEI